MGSPVARQILGTVGGGIIAVAVLSGTVASQSPPGRLRADEHRQRIAEEIGAAQVKGGPQSADLIDPLTELGELYQTEGQHALATAALEQARHLVRANYGLYTLDQLHLLEQALENQQVLGNLAMVQAIEEELFDLAERHPDDFRTVAVHRNIGERRMNILRRFMAGEAPGEIYPESGFYSFTRDAVVIDLVSEAQIHYADAAAVLLRNGINSGDELRDLEMNIVRAADLIRQRDRPDLRSTRLGAERMDSAGLGGGREYGVGRRQRGSYYIGAAETLRTQTNALWELANLESSQEAEQRRYRADRMANQYQLGRESYRRLIAYEEAVAEGALAGGSAWRSRLQAYLQLADWDLLYSVNGVALREYAQVHEMLEASDTAEPLLADIFGPPIPIVLPTFLPNPLETLASAQYIDLTFEITKFGQPKHVEISGAAPNVSDAAKDELVHLVTRSRFRPRVTNGQLASSSVLLRYHLTE